MKENIVKNKLLTRTELIKNMHKNNVKQGKKIIKENLDKFPKIKINNGEYFDLSFMK